MEKYKVTGYDYGLSEYFPSIGKMALLAWWQNSMPENHFDRGSTSAPAS
jgi:hypothetical protein